MDPDRYQMRDLKRRAAQAERDIRMLNDRVSDYARMLVGVFDAVRVLELSVNIKRPAEEE